jgi:hypothetical protein
MDFEARTISPLAAGPYNRDGLEVADRALRREAVQGCGNWQ